MSAQDRDNGHRRYQGRDNDPSSYPLLDVPISMHSPTSPTTPPPSHPVPQPPQSHSDGYDYDAYDYPSYDDAVAPDETPRQNSRGKGLPPAPGHGTQRSLGGDGAYDDSQGYGAVTTIPSPRSSYSEDAPNQHLHLRNVPGAREPARVDAGAHPGYAGSIQGSVAAPMPSHAYTGSLSGPGGPGGHEDRESFFAPPAMPWMRGEGSNGGHSAPSSRPESPSFFGGAPRVSSASPMPFYPSTSSFHAGGAGGNYAGSMYLGVGNSGAPRQKRVFQSNLLQGEVHKPWLEKPDPWMRASWWITVVLWFAGAAGAAVLCVFAYLDTPNVGKLCTSFSDDFTGSGAVDTSKWTFEVSVGGFGVGGFEWTTNSQDNAFLKNNKLYIKPTLTRDTQQLSQDQILDGISQTIDGCTSADDSTSYFRDKPLGTAAGLKKRSEVEPKRGLVGIARDVVKAPFEVVKRSFSTELPARTNNQFANPSGELDSYGLVHSVFESINDSNGTLWKRQGGNNGNTGGGGKNGVTDGATGTPPNGQHNPCNIQSAISAKAAVNPVQSARLTTKNAAGGSIKYGRVTVRAKMATGDWLFPQIMMLPTNAEYGPWPLSGEIDIALSRGNDANYNRGGRDFITSGLQWGPGAGFNAFDRTRGWWQQRRVNFNQEFHDFVLEWTPEFMWIFVDRRIQRVINLDFKKTSFFQRGHFPLTFQNGTNMAILQNPWQGQPNSAPFDKEFYLILTLGAGGINGWFPDNAGNKPWFDRSNAAMFDFANATDTWHKTWATNEDDLSMIIDSVKMETTCTK